MTQEEAIHEQVSKAVSEHIGRMTDDELLCWIMAPILEQE